MKTEGETAATRPATAAEQAAESPLLRALVARYLARPGAPAERLPDAGTSRGRRPVRT